MVAVLALATVACSSKSNATPPAASSSTPVVSSSSPAASGNTVQATANLTFDPVTITIKKGQSVTWNNSSGIPHNVTFLNGASFSQALNNGTQVNRKFTTAGTFNYYCNIHGRSMHGTIVVT